MTAQQLEPAGLGRVQPGPAGKHDIRPRYSSGYAGDGQCTERVYITPEAPEPFAARSFFHDYDYSQKSRPKL